MGEKNTFYDDQLRLHENAEARREAAKRAKREDKLAYPKGAPKDRLNEMAEFEDSMLALSDKEDEIRKSRIRGRLDIGSENDNRVAEEQGEGSGFVTNVEIETLGDTVNRRITAKEREESDSEPKKLGREMEDPPKETHFPENFRPEDKN